MRIVPLLKLLLISLTTDSRAPEIKWSIIESHISLKLRLKTMSGLKVKKALPRSKKISKGPIKAYRNSLKI